MPKALQAENLLQLMEWLRLGKKFYIHNEFLKYLKMSDIIRLCLVSKHYNKKYLNYCYNYFMSSCSCVLHIIKNNNNLYSCYSKKVNKKKELIQKTFPEYRFQIHWLEEITCYNDYLELKTLYGVNNKITKLVDRYFGNKL